MSKQSVYTVHSGDECGGDPCYNVLKGPGDFECWLTEPEDRSFWRDLSPVVERLESLEQSNTQLREQNRVLAEAFAKTTKGKVTINRYEHGGGRMFVDDGKNRDLIADTYNEGDREFIALCYEVFSKRAALTATSQPAKEPVRHLCGARGFGQFIDDRCPGCDATSQEGQG